MKFAAVKSFFKPVSGVQLTELARKHAGGRGEQSVCLEEVGLDQVARKLTSRVNRQPPPAAGHLAAASPVLLEGRRQRRRT
jgi:hypothetical protein